MSIAEGPSNSCEDGEAPIFPEDSSALSAGTHNRVQCGCLILANQYDYVSFIEMRNFRKKREVKAGRKGPSMFIVIKENICP